MEHQHHQKEVKSENIRALAFGATSHCLLGCGIGEVIGMIVSVQLELAMLTATIVSIFFGFIMGLALGVIPLIKRNLAMNKALQIVIIGEGLSIAVMETFEVIAQMAIPGVMTAQLSDLLFWQGMFASLVVGFIAAFPVNYIMIKRGIRHQH